MTMIEIVRKVRRRIEPLLLKTIRGIPAFEFEEFATYRDYCDAVERSQGRDEVRARAEMDLIANGSAGVPFEVPGYCGACERWVRFRVDWSFAPAGSGSRPMPNWRETLSCPICGLNNRMRAVLGLFRQRTRIAPTMAVYMTEEVTSLFQRVRALCPNTEGSEFLTDGTLPGTRNAAGVRFEDLTRLTFEDDRFDSLLCFEVLEHVPDYRAALRECARVSRPGGAMLLTVPFHGGPATTVRARIGPGGIEHLLPPEYHGDPLSDAGCLCFYHFGGDLLDEIRAAGFRQATMGMVYSRPLGHLLRHCPIFVAIK